jgi:hypothetical protein
VSDNIKLSIKQQFNLRSVRQTNYKSVCMNIHNCLNTFLSSLSMKLKIRISVTMIDQIKHKFEE